MYVHTCYVHPLFTLLVLCRIYTSRRLVFQCQENKYIYIYIYVFILEPFALLSCMLQGMYCTYMRMWGLSKKVLPYLLDWALKIPKFANWFPTCYWRSTVINLASSLFHCLLLSKLVSLFFERILCRPLYPEPPLFPLTKSYSWVARLPFPFFRQNHWASPHPLAICHLAVYPYACIISQCYTLSSCFECSTPLPPPPPFPASCFAFSLELLALWLLAPTHSGTSACVDLVI